MTSSAITGGTYYVLRSRVMPGLYKPGIAHNFSQRLRQHGGPELWETLATYYLGQGAAYEHEQKMLCRFGHRRIAPPPEERMALTDQELAELLTLSEQEHAKTAEGRPEPIPAPHARRQIEHAALVARLKLRPRPTRGLDYYLPRAHTPAAVTAQPESGAQDVAAGMLAVLALVLPLGGACIVAIALLQGLARIHPALGTAGLMGLAAVPAVVAARKVRA